MALVAGQHQQQGYRYTSAEALLEATREARAKAGLAIVQCGWDRLEGSRLSVRYLLTHKSGVSWELPRCTVPVVTGTVGRRAGDRTDGVGADPAARQRGRDGQRLADRPRLGEAPLTRTRP